jgi:hypothetical protein
LVRDFQEGIDFFFLQVRDGVLLTPLEGDTSDLATPLHMLGASFANETAQRMDRGESLVAGTNSATPHPFKFREKSLNHVTREIINCERIDPFLAQF